MIWAIVLLIIGIGLVVLEVLLPSGGLISLMAAVAIVSSLILGFMNSSVLGVTLSAVTFVCLPTAIVVALKILPSTSLGRRMFLIPKAASVSSAGPSGQDDYAGLFGKAGIAVTELRPSGIAEIGQKRYSVVAECEMIDKGTEIVVVKIEGNNIVVDPKPA